MPIASSSALPSRRTRAALAALLVTLAGCGKKGPPLPPIRVEPQAVTNLTLRQEGQEIVVSFTVPTTTTAGTPLEAREAVVMRLRSEDPEADAGAEDVPRGRFMGSRDFLGDAEVLRKVERADMPRLTRDGRIEVRDDLVGEPVGGPSAYRFYYAVAVLDDDERESRLSNVESIVPLEAPQAPEGLEAAAAGTTVKLDWSPPGKGKPPAGYSVYRSIDGGPSVRLGVPTKATELVDSPSGDAGEVIYLVRSSATLDEPYVESAEGARASVSLKDSQAPSPPTKVRVSAGPGRLEVFWERSKASDVSGYHVYRAERSEGPYAKLTDKPAPETVYLDAGASSGSTYHYAVTAVDRAGNESARSDPASGRR